MLYPALLFPSIFYEHRAFQNFRLVLYSDDDDAFYEPNEYDPSSCNKRFSATLMFCYMIHYAQKNNKTDRSNQENENVLEVNNKVVGSVVVSKINNGAK